MSLVLALTIIGLLALGFILLPFWRRLSLRGSDHRIPEAAQDLLETKWTLYRGMKELEFDYQAGHLSDDDYQRLQASYEARAAQVLKGLDELGVSREEKVAAREPARARAGRPSGPSPEIHWTRRPVVLVSAAAILVGFGLALGILLTRFTTPEPVASAGGAGAMVMPLPTAPLAGPATQGGAPPIPPEVLRGMLDAAHQSLDAGRYQEAISAYKAVLARQPDNVEAITHLAIILGIAGHAEAAIETLDKALSIDPNYAHALWDKGRLLYEAKEYAQAISAWERFLTVASPGPDRDRAQTLIQEAKGRLLQKK